MNKYIYLSKNFTTPPVFPSCKQILADLIEEFEIPMDIKNHPKSNKTNNLQMWDEEQNEPCDKELSSSVLLSNPNANCIETTSLDKKE